MSIFDKVQLSLSLGSHLDDEGSVAVASAKQKLAPPSMYQVILTNDDFTPMDFVIEVLETFFNLSREKATQVMLTIHTQGQAVCGVYTKDVAGTKARLVNCYARENQHPLLCIIKKNN